MSEDFFDLLRNRPARVIQRNQIRIAICCPLVVVCAILSVPFYLHVAIVMPKCKLSQIYIPALEKPFNSSTNYSTTLTFHIQLENTDDNRGVIYNSINVTFSESSNRSHSIASFTIPKFYESFKSKTTKGGTVNTIGLDREAAIEAISANRSAVFRVDMSASMKFKFIFWKTKTYWMKLGANVPITNAGTMIHPKKGISLTFYANKIGNSYGLLLASFFVLVLSVFG